MHSLCRHSTHCVRRHPDSWLSDSWPNVHLQTDCCSRAHTRSYLLPPSPVVRLSSTTHWYHFERLSSCLLPFSFPPYIPLQEELSKAQIQPLETAVTLVSFCSGSQLQAQAEPPGGLLKMQVSGCLLLRLGCSLDF